MDRGAVADASQRLDARLALRPAEEGESRPRGLRIGFELPLRAMFRVDETDRRVFVVSVGIVAMRRR